MAERDAGTPSAVPAQGLVCPDPAHCPVIGTDSRLVTAAPTMVIGEHTQWYRVYDGTWGYDEPDPGFGDSRFAPFDDLATGDRVPTLYLAGDITGALLETVFHDADHHGGTVVAEETLRRSLLASVRTPCPLRLVDFRDPVLEAVRVDREAISASSQEHYPCTRRVARAVHGRTDPAVQGIIWHSRQAELQRAAGHEVTRSEVVVVFCDRLGLSRGSWQRTGPGSQALIVDSGRDLVDRLAERIGVTILMR